MAGVEFGTVGGRIDRDDECEMSGSDSPLQPRDFLEGEPPAPGGARPDGRGALAGGPGAVERTGSDLLRHAARPPVRLPGPGLPEAIAWTLGTLLVHRLAVVIVLGGVAVLYGGPPWRDGLSLETVLETVDAAVLFGGEQLVFVVFAAIAVAVRLRLSHNDYSLEERLARKRGWAGPPRGSSGRLALDPIAPGHVVLMLALVLPVNVLASKGQEAFTAVWNGLAARVPGMQEVGQARAVEGLLSSLQGASFPTLLFVLALLPAVGEELVFRGVVGRGLTARWGLWRGVVLTSLLFALVHEDPVHAAGVFPLGVMMHVAYLATRSFWAPVLYHFFNNSIYAARVWASGRVLEDPEVQEAAAQAAGGLPAIVYVAAALCVVSATMLLWRTRVEHVLPDGTVWDPGYVTAEAPPESLETVRLCRRAADGCYAFATTGMASFGAALLYALWPAP